MASKPYLEFGQVGKRAVARLPSQLFIAADDVRRARRVVRSALPEIIQVTKCAF